MHDCVATIMMFDKKKRKNTPVLASGFYTRSFHADKVWVSKSPFAITWCRTNPLASFRCRKKQEDAGAVFVQRARSSICDFIAAQLTSSVQTQTELTAHACTHCLTGTCCSFDHIMFIPMRTQRKQMTFQQWKMIPPLRCSLTINISDTYQDVK